MSRYALLAGIVICTTVFACKKTPEKIISINPSEFTTEQQVKIGNAFKNELDNHIPAFNILKKHAYPEAYQYLNVLFNTMLNTASVKHRRDYDWSVSIIHDDSMRTAFFLPGGHFYISTGLLKFLDRESQLLSLIGHEMFYADTDLLIKKMSSEFGGTSLGDIILDNPVENLDEFTASMPFLSFPETAVLAADSFSIQLICPFNYEPHGLKTILEKSYTQQTELLWLNTRQANELFRLRRIEHLSSQCGYPGIGNEHEYERFKTAYLP